MNSPSDHKKLFVSMSILLIVLLALGVFIYINPGNIFTEAGQSSDVQPGDQSIDAVAAPIEMSIPSVNVAGKYVLKDRRGTMISEIRFTQDGNQLSFGGSSIYPRYDENWEVVSANLGDLGGTTTLSVNKAQLVITDYMYGEYAACVIDFVFNNDKTLDVSINDDGLQSCGWGNNVSFAGHYTRE